VARAGHPAVVAAVRHWSSGSCWRRNQAPGPVTARAPWPEHDAPVLTSLRSPSPAPPSCLNHQHLPARIVNVRHLHLRPHRVHLSLAGTGISIPSSA